MSSRRARAEVPGVGAVHLALHEAHDQYISEEIDALGSWEPFETEVIRRFLSPGDLIVDAGANIGWYSVVAALLGAEVLAYEPMTGNVALLEQNLGLNDVAHRVTVVRAALGDHAGQASLQLSSDNQGDHRVSATPVGDTQTIDVRTLDDELALRPTRLLKVDTQGSEARVLRGGRRSLSPDRAVGTVMILEFWAYGLADCGSSAEELIGLIAAYVPTTHACFEIIERTSSLRPITLTELAVMVRAGDYSVEGGGHTNIVLVPVGEVPAIADLIVAGADTDDGPFDLQAVERSFSSQFGEDGVLEDLARRVQAPRTMIELGAGDGTECNSRHPRSSGWAVAAFDGDPGDSDWVVRKWIDAANAPQLVESSGFGDRFGILSIDLDGNDYWVLRSILRRSKPCLIVCEYNATLGPVEALTVRYRPHRRWDHTNYFGASLAAYAYLGAAHGYALVGCGSEGVNAYLVREDLLEMGRIRPVSVASAYRPPTYGSIDALGGHVGHQPTGRRFVRVVDAASADAAMRAASGRPPTRFVRELALSLHTHDLLRYRRTLLRNLRNRLRGVPTK